MNTNQQTQQVRENSIGWMLSMSSRIAHNLLKKQLKSLGILPEHFVLLMILLEKDGVIQSILAEKTNLPQYSITRHIDSLEQKQLVRREADPSSRRSWHIYTTDKCTQLAPQLYAVVKVVNQKLLANLSDNEAKQLCSLLAKIIY